MLYKPGDVPELAVFDPLMFDVDEPEIDKGLMIAGATEPEVTSVPD